MVVRGHLNLRCAGGPEKYSCHGGGGHEGEEVAVVASPDTVVEPHAMVVLSVDAAVAYAAVMASRWSPYLACFAVLHWHFKCAVAG